MTPTPQVDLTQLSPEQHAQVATLVEDWIRQIRPALTSFAATLTCSMESIIKSTHDDTIREIIAALRKMGRDDVANELARAFDIVVSK